MNRVLVVCHGLSPQRVKLRINPSFLLSHRALEVKRQLSIVLYVPSSWRCHGSNCRIQVLFKLR
jgi:hypothetical protein